MNERIRELLKQADLQPYYDAQEAAIEKFAELIAEDLITEVSQYSCSGGDGDSYAEGVVTGYNDAVAQIVAGLKAKYCDHSGRHLLRFRV